MPGATRYDIEHVSRYLYSSPVRHSVMSLCMRPRDDSGQRLLRFEIATSPRASLNAEIDGFGNTKHVLNIHREHANLENYRPRLGRDRPRRSPARGPRPRRVG